MNGSRLTSRLNQVLGAPRRVVGCLLALAVPRDCAGCGAANTGWCDTCALQLGRLRRVRRRLLGDTLPTYALGWYRAAARRAVLAYKERGRRDLARPFGEALAAALRRLARAESPGPVAHWWLVPAPSRPAAARSRGGPHMLRVAAAVAAAWARMAPPESIAQVAPCLALSRHARDSVGLDPPSRMRNLAEHVLVRTDHLPPPGSAVVLLDDVITTGATAAACAAALSDCGVRVAYVLSLTATTGWHS